MIVRKIRSEYERVQKERGRITRVDIRRISARCFREIKDEPKHKIFRLCEQLLDAGYSIIPFDWAHRLEKRFARTDFRRFEYMIFAPMHLGFLFIDSPTPFPERKNGQSQKIDGKDVPLLWSLSTQPDGINGSRRFLSALISS
jgi:hypothetical protein